MSKRFFLEKEAKTFYTNVTQVNVRRVQATILLKHMSRAPPDCLSYRPHRNNSPRPRQPSAAAIRKGRVPPLSAADWNLSQIPTISVA
jgi:hypothetical protein